jgi:hypothetical protein
MNNNQNSTVVRVVALVVILLVGIGALAYTFLGKKSTTTVPDTSATTTDTSSQTQTPADQQSPTQTESAQPQATNAGTSTYKDGTYSATGSYLSPGGDEKIGVTVTLKDDIITAASVTPEPVSGEGQQYQTIFKNNFQALVVGKDIASVHLTEVSGSSLTPGGFDSALTMIEAQAKA